MNSSTYVKYLTGFTDGFTWDYLDEISKLPEEKKRNLTNNKYNAYYYAYILGLIDTYPETPEMCDEKQLCSMLVQQYGSHMKLLEACKAKARSKEDVLYTADHLTLECKHNRYKIEHDIPYDHEMVTCAYLQRQQAYYALSYEPERDSVR